MGHKFYLKKKIWASFSLYTTKEGLPVQLFSLTLWCLETDMYAIELDQV